MARLGVNYGGGSGFGNLIGSAHQQGGFQRGLADAARTQFGQNQALMGNQMQLSNMLQQQANADRQFGFQREQFDAANAYRDRDFNRNDERYNAALDLDSDRYANRQRLTNEEVLRKEKWASKNYALADRQATFGREITGRKLDENDRRYQDSLDLAADQRGERAYESDREFGLREQAQKNLEVHRASQREAAGGGSGGGRGRGLTDASKIRGQAGEAARLQSQMDEIGFQLRTASETDRPALQSQLQSLAGQVRAATPVGFNAPSAGQLIDPAMQRSYRAEHLNEAGELITPPDYRQRLQGIGSNIPGIGAGALSQKIISDDFWKQSKEYRDWARKNAGRYETLLDAQENRGLNKTERAELDLIELKKERTRMATDAQMGLTDQFGQIHGDAINATRDLWQNLWGR